MFQGPQHLYDMIQSLQFELSHGAGWQHALGFLHIVHLLSFERHIRQPGQPGQVFHTGDESDWKIPYL